MILKSHKQGDQPKWIAGRASLLKDEESWKTILAAQWDLSSKSIHFNISFDNMESELNLSFSLGPALYLSLPIRNKGRLETFLNRIKHKTGVEFQSYSGIDFVRLAVHNGAIWWSFMCPDDVWTNTTPKHRHGSFHVVDFFFGSMESTSVKSDYFDEEVEVDIPLPEGPYTWKIKRETTKLSRPRWPFPTFIKRWHAAPLDGHQIPFPGKGESSWNCGPDALFGSSGEGYSISDAISGVVNRVLRYRLRNGTKNMGYNKGGRHDPLHMQTPISLPECLSSSR